MNENDEHMDEWKEENYIPLGINAGGIIILYMYIDPGQEQTTSWRQFFYVNRKALSLCPFVASLKKVLFYTHFVMILYMYIAIFFMFLFMYMIGPAVLEKKIFENGGR